jgi:hypothetical protein
MPARSELAQVDHLQDVVPPEAEPAPVELVV